MTLCVLKFGGTSVGTVAAMRSTVERIASAASPGPVVVVVSAFSGVTDDLAAAVLQAAQRDARYRNVVCTLRQRTALLLSSIASGSHARQAEAHCAEHLQRLKELLDAVALLRRCPEELHDEAMSLGERLCASVVAAGVATLDVPVERIDAGEIVRTDSTFGEAEIDFDLTSKAARSLVRGNGATIVPGFFGADRRGRTVLLGRGGSDTTATVLGAALSADRVEIWTDVDGVLTADPRHVPTARSLSALSYADAAEAAFFGAKVLHPRALGPAAAARVPVTVRNSFAGGPGTRIDEGPSPEEAFTVALTADVSLISRRPGARALESLSAAAARARVPVLLEQDRAMGESWVAIPATARARVTREMPFDTAFEGTAECTGMAIVAAIGPRARERSHLLIEILSDPRLGPLVVVAGARRSALVALLPVAAARGAVEALHRELAERGRPVREPSSLFGPRGVWYDPAHAR